MADKAKIIELILSPVNQIESTVDRKFTKGSSKDWTIKMYYSHKEGKNLIFSFEDKKDTLWGKTLKTTVYACTNPYIGYVSHYDGDKISIYTYSNESNSPNGGHKYSATVPNITPITDFLRKCIINPNRTAYLYLKEVEG